MERKPIVANTELIAICGLYCGACPKYLKGKCLGCKENVKAKWCKTRTCALELNIKSCADCTKVNHVKSCKYHNNAFSRIFEKIFNSNRAACIDMIKQGGYDNFATFMTQNKQMSVKRK